MNLEKMSLEELISLRERVNKEIEYKQPKLKDYVVRYGDSLRDSSEWYCEAKSENNAKTLFRNEFGYNYIKIQSVKEINK